MPPEERRAYNREKERSAGQSTLGSKPLTDVVDMSPEIKAMYERAVGNVEQKLGASQPQKELPRTEDIYRQSAPDDMKHLPSDESIYRPSRPLIDTTNSAIEPEPAFGMNRFISSILWVLVLVAVAYLVTQLLF